jgi:hypothetical protein
MAVVTKTPAAVKPADAPAVEAVKDKEKKAQWGDRNEEGILKEKLDWAKGREFPAGYDVNKHTTLVRKDFKTMADFLQYRADQLMSAAVEMQQSADDERSGKGQGVKAKQKKFVKLAETYTSLLAELKAAGVDVSKLVPQS